MSRGHGAMGLLDNLRTLIDLADDSSASRRPYLDFFPGVNIAATSWVLNSGAAYQYNGLISYTLSGMTLEIVGVDTSLGSLTRVESLADCVATAGTFYSTPNIGASTPVPLWDDGVTLWDAAGVTWDHVVAYDLYVHLSGDANPNTQTVVPLLGLYFGTSGEVHPVLGPDKLTNGNFENGLTGWNQRFSPGWDDGVTLWDGTVTWDSGMSSASDTVLFYGIGSTASLKLSSGGTTTGYASYYQDLTTVSGKTYRLSFYYRTDPAFSSNLAARVLVGNTAGTVVLYSDGRDGDASGQATLTPTGGEWRKAFFDFLAPASTTRVELRLAAPASTGVGQANFDGVKLQRIYRFAYYEPRLDASSLQDITVGSQSIFFDAKNVSISSLSFIDADAVYAPLLAQLLTANRAARLAIGGALGNGQDIYRDDWQDEFYGLTRDLWTMDERIQVNLDDPTTLMLDVELPKRRYTLADFPSLDPNKVGFARPLVFGDFSANGQDGIIPARINLTSNGYGIFELADVVGTPGLHSVVGLSVYRTTTLEGQYPDDQQFTIITEQWYNVRNFTGYNVFTWGPGKASWSTFPAGLPTSVDLAGGLLTLLHNVQNFNYVKGSGDQLSRSSLDFNIGGGTISGQGTDPPYVRPWWSAEQAADQFTDEWTNLAGTAITWSYSRTTHKFKVSVASGALNLLPKSGNAAGQPLWLRLGFHTDSDRTGALSYTADDAVYTSPELDLIFRVRMRGIADDASGTYTGAAGALVQLPGDIFKLIVKVYLGGSVNDSSVTAARSSAYASKNCRLFLDKPTKVRDIFARLAAVGLADIVVDGSGSWYYKPYVNGTPADVIDFFDRDYLSWKMGRRPSDVYRNVELTYGIRPTVTTPRSSQYVYDSGIPTKYGRQETLREDTALVASADVDTLGAAVAKLGGSAPRIVEFSARGKLVGVLPGRKIRLTRARGLDSSGALNAVLFRVMSLKRSPMTGVTTCTAVEDVSFA